MSSSPEVKSFLLADNVFQDAQGKWCIIGAFDRIVAAKFPCKHPALGLFFKVADAVGEFDVSVEFHDSAGRKLSQIEGLRVRIPDRLSEPGFGLTAYDLPIPKAGTYYVRLFFNRAPARGQDIRLEASHGG